MPSTGHAWKQSSLKMKPKLSEISDEKKRKTVLDAFQEKKPIHEAFSAFFSDTSFTALARIYKAQSIFKRLAWTILVLGMISWLAVQCYWLLAKYFSYPIEVKLDMKAASSLEFPSVTICNLNPIRSVHVETSPYDSLYKYTQNTNNDSLFMATILNWKFENEVCGPGEYRCNSGQCINAEFVCDGHPDCNSQDDEESCSSYTCLPGLWQCWSNSKCIYITQICDGINNCAQSEDEENCGGGTCPQGYFACDTGLCIPNYYVCDNFVDCPHREDEDRDCTGFYSTGGTASTATGGTPPTTTRGTPPTTTGGTSPTTTGGTSPTTTTGNTSPTTTGGTRPTTTGGTSPTTTTGGTSSTTTGGTSSTTTGGTSSTTTGGTSPTTTTGGTSPTTTGGTSPTTTGDTSSTTTGGTPPTTWPTPAGSSSSFTNTLTSLRTSTDFSRRKREASYVHVNKNIYYSRHHKKVKTGEHQHARWRKDIAKLRSLMTTVTGKMDEEEFNRLLHKSYMAFIDRKIAQRRSSKEKRTGRSKIRKHHIMKRYASRSSSEEEERLSVNWTSVFSNSSFNKWDMLDQGINLSSSFYFEKDIEYEATMSYAYITAKLDPDFVEKSGHEKKDFIASCRFGGYQCSPANFSYFHSHKYGNCYTFNSRFFDTKLETRFPGPEYGLRLDLFIEQSQYVPNLATEAGARILVHKKGSMPFPEDEGISVMPGRSTSVGIRQVTLSRLPPPYGVCGKAQRMDYYVENLGTDYSKLSCLKSCYQDIIMKHCDCAVTFYYIPDSSNVCNMTNQETEQCVTGLPQNHPELYIACDTVCPQPCEEVGYDLSISAAKWPSEPYEDFLTRQLGQTNSLYLQTDDSDDEFTRVQIYFQDLIFQFVEQQKAYESMNLISDLGGQLGLWLGLSAITIGELCSFLFSLGRYLPASWSDSKAKPLQPGNEMTPINVIHPATLEEMYQDICPDVSKYIPPDIARPSMNRATDA